jgi:hypothetical protein
MRIDKKFFFNRFTLNLYFDVQNVFGSSLAAAPNLDVDLDENGNPLVGPDGNYEYTVLENSLGNTLPTVGIIIGI